MCLSNCPGNRVISCLVFVPAVTLRNRERFADTSADWAHFIIISSSIILLLYECFLCFLYLLRRLASRVPHEAVHIFLFEIFADRLLFEHFKLWLLAHKWSIGDCDSHARG